MTKVNRCLAEGRKSFLERYAGIESGQECERLAGSLSAFVDGEADATQTVQLRRHLRHCLACRAAVRGLHDAGPPLTVVFPAAVVVVAGEGAEHTGSLFVRVYETVTMHLHERAANSFLRAQAIVDTVTAGTMAAAAASAAAVAGGSVAVQDALRAPAPLRAALVQRADPGAGVPFVRQAAGSTAARGGHKPKPRARTTQRPRAKPHRSAPPPRAHAPAPATPTAAAPTPAARATTAVVHGSGGSAAGEFGFEGG